MLHARSVIPLRCFATKDTALTLCKLLFNDKEKLFAENDAPEGVYTREDEDDTCCENEDSQSSVAVAIFFPGASVLGAYRQSVRTE